MDFNTVVVGSNRKEVARLERHHLIILNVFGIMPFDTQSRAALMEIIEDRHCKGSTILISQTSVSKWHDFIGENTVANTIMYRIVHETHRSELRGESLRRMGNEETDLSAN